MTTWMIITIMAFIIIFTGSIIVRKIYKKKTKLKNQLKTRNFLLNIN